MYIIVAGNLSDGFTFVGPFNEQEDAFEYADEHLGHVITWVATLDTPETKGINYKHPNR